MTEHPKDVQEHEQEGAVFVLGDTLLVISAKLVKRILTGDFLDMAELLKDNIEAERSGLRKHWYPKSQTGSSQLIGLAFLP